MTNRSNQIVSNCKYHVVFCPKYRRSVLVDGVDQRLKEIIEETCNEFGIKLSELEINPDSVHMVIDVEPRFGVHRAVKRIKGKSSSLLRQEFSWLRSRLPTLWTNSYYISTYGSDPSDDIKEYIHNQKNV